MQVVYESSDNLVDTVMDIYPGDLYADNMALLAELLHTLTHGLGVISEEASLLGL